MEEEEVHPAEVVDLAEAEAVEDLAEAVVAAAVTVVTAMVVEEEAVAAAEMEEANKQTFLLALVTGNAQFSTAETQTLPGETTATNAKPLNQLEPEVVVMTEVETAEEVEDLVEAGAAEDSVEATVVVVEALEVAGAAEDSVEATEIVAVVEEALEVAAEAVPCVEAGAVETVIVHTKQEQQTKQDMPPLASVSPPSVFSLAPGIYYLSRSFFRSFPTISSPNGLVLL